MADNMYIMQPFALMPETISSQVTSFNWFWSDFAIVCVLLNKEYFQSVFYGSTVKHVNIFTVLSNTWDHHKNLNIRLDASAKAIELKIVRGLLFGCLDEMPNLCEKNSNFLAENSKNLIASTC